MINYILLVNGQGTIRTVRYYKHHCNDERKQLESNIIKLCLSRNDNQCSIVDYEDYNLVYRKFGTVMLIAGITPEENELAVMEMFQLFLESLNKLLGKITEVHLLYNLDKVHMVLDELIINGCLNETCQNRLLAPIQLMSSAK